MIYDDLMSYIGSNRVLLTLLLSSHNLSTSVVLELTCVVDTIDLLLLSDDVALISLSNVACQSV